MCGGDKCRSCPIGYTGRKDDNMQKRKATSFTLSEEAYQFLLKISERDMRNKTREVEFLIFKRAEELGMKSKEA